MSVDNVGSKGGDEAAGLGKAREETCRRTAHVEVNGFEAGGPLLGNGRPKDQKSGLMAAICHAFAESQRELFRSSHAERSKHIDDAHGALTFFL
jgi:hypothetical protein